MITKEQAAEIERLAENCASLYSERIAAAIRMPARYLAACRASDEANAKLRAYLATLTEK